MAVISFMIQTPGGRCYKGATALHLVTFSIMTLSVKYFLAIHGIGATTLSIIKFSIMIFSTTINKMRHSAK